MRVRKSVLEVELFHDFFHSCLEQKNNIFHKKFEFFDKGRIKYEFLTRLKLKTRKHQNINLKIEFCVVFFRHLYKNTYRGSASFRTISTNLQFILNFFIETRKIAIFFQLRVRKSYVDVEFFHYFLHTC